MLRYVQRVIQWEDKKINYDDLSHNVYLTYKKAIKFIRKLFCQNRLSYNTTPQIYGWFLGFIFSHFTHKYGNWVKTSGGRWSRQHNMSLIDLLPDTERCFRFVRSALLFIKTWSSLWEHISFLSPCHFCACCVWRQTVNCWKENNRRQRVQNIHNC